MTSRPTFVALTLFVMISCSDKPPEKITTSHDTIVGQGDQESGGTISPVPNTTTPGSNPTSTPSPVPTPVPGNTSNPGSPTPTPGVPMPTPTPTPTPSVPTPQPSPGTAVDLQGHLDVSFTMVGPAKAGAFRSRGHIRAVWLTDANNKFVRTLDYHAATRAKYLLRFNSFAQKSIDGTTGATDKSLNSTVPVSASWDLKDKAGVALKSGSYKIWFEMAEANVSGSPTAPLDTVQSIDSQSGYAFHAVPVTLGADELKMNDNKSPVFTTIVIHRRLD